MILILIAIPIASSILCGFIASSKGRSPGWWALWGFLFPLFGLIAAAGVSDKRNSVPTAAVSTPTISPPHVHDWREIDSWGNISVEKCVSCGLVQRRLVQRRLARPPQPPQPPQQHEHQWGNAEKVTNSLGDRVTLTKLVQRCLTCPSQRTVS